ncbi:hypothetical protein A2U01_0045587 [Trifolium medium]|uniref:Uncharacterized protein n=1 Tax=Trifolium medium TaxID=97028 RepID=A0A392QKJ3_9FABA|nr:hypothetical protein [Trifolium medium]
MILSPHTIAYFQRAIADSEQRKQGYERQIRDLKMSKDFRVAFGSQATDDIDAQISELENKVYVAQLSINSSTEALAEHYNRHDRGGRRGG